MGGQSKTSLNDAGGSTTNRKWHTSAMQILIGCVVISIEILAMAQPTLAHCDKTFTPTEVDQNISATRAFVAPGGARAKPYIIRQNEQGNIVASKNGNLTSGAPSKQESQASESSLTKPTTTLTSNTTEGTAFHCLYKFIAGKNQRVAINFTSFRLRGDEPECNREYVDIYAHLKSEDQLETSIASELPNGRFCTTVVPHTILSLNNMIVLSIYTDSEPPLDGRPLFTGDYEFFDIKSDELGPPEERTLCTHTIYSTATREGEFQSVTYPGVYEKDLRCSYKFIGEPDQRIRVEFLDLDLYSGGIHCPFDSIKIFDGLEETDPLIQTICGSHHSLVIYSTHEHLLITFNTLRREAEVQNRGFSAYFEFSDRFYNPKFIQGPFARHMRGSECDQRVISAKISRGQIVSPIPRRDHPNSICRYYFEGLQSSHVYEKVVLRFVEFDLKTPRFVSAPIAGGQQVTSTTFTSTSNISSATTSSSNTSLAQNSAQINATSTNDPNSNSNLNANSSNVDQCPDNYVRIYTSEQKPDQKQDPNDYDYTFCSNELPPTIESDAVSLLMEYNSGSIGGYFKAEYSFIEDFRIPGNQLSTSCNYIYKSDIMKTGTFNSPRYPSWYIDNMNCTYTFLSKPDEALLIQFPSFRMAYSNSSNDKALGYNEACHGEDLVEIDEISFEVGSEKVMEQAELSTYCGTTTPGPLLSFKPIRVHFRTNEDRVHYGFVATYHFYSLSELHTEEFMSSCGEQIHSSYRFRTGIFSSPPTYRPDTYEKRNHICSWNITARPSHRIALDFTRFELEGNQAVRGCITATVRLEFDKTKLPMELCGTLPTSNGTGHQYVSEGESFVVTFISTKQASGSGGFTATWTEIKRTS